jgi:hypothetical protein
MASIHDEGWSWGAPYAAGLILEDAHFQTFANRGEQQLEDLVHPLLTFLVPVSFVVMGMRVDTRGNDRKASVRLRSDRPGT